MREKRRQQVMDSHAVYIASTLCRCSRAQVSGGEVGRLVRVPTAYLIYILLHIFLEDRIMMNET